MDHVGALPYWFSQRNFQKLEGGRCACHPDTAGPLQKMLGSWIDLELQRTPHEIVAVAPNEEIPIRQNVVLRAIETRHTCPSLGWAIVEYRHKLKDAYGDLPQSRLRDLREAGEEITSVTEIPLVAYTGDTARGAFLERDEFSKAKILIAECTFFDPDHRERAAVGKHLHFDDLVELIPQWEAEHIVIVHLSRRTLVSAAAERIRSLGADAERIHLLMDHRANRQRYDQQLEGDPNHTTTSP
jgi:ribonuclease Z